jgi:putative tricarboxylic transport membrane protein
MRKAHIIANFFWLALSAAVCIESIRLKIGSFHAPGPAFLPFFAGLLLGILSFISLVQSLKEKEEEGTRIWGDVSPLKLILMLIVLFLYTALLKTMGFLIGTFLLLIFLFRVVEPLRWRTVLIASLLTIGTAYLLFGILLESQLPKGILGF